ncbi:hypothetical protein [Alistipes sp.]
MTVSVQITADGTPVVATPLPASLGGYDMTAYNNPVLLYKPDSR